MSGESVARTHLPEQLYPGQSSEAPTEVPPRTGSSVEPSKAWAAPYRTRRFFIQFEIGICRTAGACQIPAGDSQTVHPENEPPAPAALRSLAALATKPQAVAVQTGSGSTAKAASSTPLANAGVGDAKTSMFAALDIGTTVTPPDGGQPPYR